MTEKWVEDYANDVRRLIRGNYGNCPGCEQPLTVTDVSNQIDAETQERAELCVECWKKTLEGK
jgi:hypothetical protein